MIILIIVQLVLTPWRLLSLIRKVKEHRKSLVSGKKPRTSLRWRICMSGMYYVLTDYLVLI